MSSTFNRRTLLGGLAVAGVAAATGEQLIRPSTAAATEIFPVVGQGTGNRVHVMSYNIRVPVDPASGGRKWEHRRTHIHKLINTELPTTLGIQEARTEQVEWLGANLPPRYKILAENAWAPGSRKHPPTADAIIYDSQRLKLLDHGFRWYSANPNHQGTIWAGQGFNRVRMFTWAKYSDNNTGKTFVHLNTHLDLVASYRRRSAKALRDFADTFKLPWVITGDFNCDDATEPHTQICRGDAYDTWQASGAKRTPYYRTTIPVDRSTSKWGPAPRTTGNKIDWVVVSKTWKTGKAAINTWVPADCPVYGAHAASDHWPVHARIYL